MYQYVLMHLLGKKLKQGMKYSFFVRVWYSTTVFGDFKSDGVIVTSQPPITRVLNGAAVFCFNNKLIQTKPPCLSFREIV